MQIGILTTMLSSGKSWSLQMPGLMPDHAVSPHLESISAGSSLTLQSACAATVVDGDWVFLFLAWTKDWFVDGFRFF
jgi:hypothetical protein